ncbi:MAG: sulfatase-like hydrolase/transferase, partial [Deltaproteobacteria bacterium]|nr:sulfatase-like hydrolase/transferase [Deltaproteobacteria bacterium]
MLLDNHYNIFLIVIDALRPDHLGCYGYERETSPTIDKIAEEGVMFERVISQSSWTKPSMASLLTSTYPEVHGVKKIADRLCYHDTFLPAILQKIGYITGCIQTNPFLSSPSGFDQGFDHYIELFDSAPGVYKP